MVTISHLVKKIVEEKPLLQEAFSQEIISFPNLAENLRPLIEQELGKKVKNSAIVMALRRYAERQSASDKIKKKLFKFNSETVMKTGLIDLTFVKSPSLLAKLKKIYDFIDYDKGETLNIIQGNYEVTIVISRKYKEKVLSILKDEKIINIEKNLVSLALSFSKDFFYTPGILAQVTRKLAWENVNLIENISTMTELIFIVAQKDSVKTYKVLRELINL